MYIVRSHTYINIGPGYKPLLPVLSLITHQLIIPTARIQSRGHFGFISQPTTPFLSGNGSTCTLLAGMELLRAVSAERIPDTVGFPDRHPGVPTKAHGWFLDTHKRVFDRVLNPETKIIIELGSWFGSSAKWFCENTSATIFSIDLWDDSFILRDEHYIDSNSKVRLVDVLLFLMTTIILKETMHMCF